MLKLERDKLLIGAVLVLVISLDMMNTSMLTTVLPSISNLVSFFAVLLLVLRFPYIHHYSLSYLLMAPVLFLSGLLVYFQAGNLNFLMYMLLIILLYRADMESILKIYVSVGSFFLVVVVLLALLDVIPNLQFTQYRSAGIVIRNSFGFIYPTDFASHCFYLYTAFSYLMRKKFILLRTIFGLGLAYFIIKYCDARLNAASIALMSLIFLYFYYRKDVKSHLFAFLPLSAGLASSVMTYLSHNFTWSHPLYVTLNNFTNMRLHLGHEALKKYGVQLFGIRGISFIGYGGKTETVLSYDYVDSSYVQMLFTYGMIPVILLVCLYMMRSWTLYREKNYLLLAALSLIAVNCMFEAFWVRPSYNIFIFITFAALPAGELLSKKSKTRNSV